jgi:exportin-7
MILIKPSPTAKPNNNPIYVDPPSFVKSVPNGKLFTVGIGEDEINIVHVWGTPYEMGYAQGELMKDVASTFIDDVWTYLEEEAVGSCKRLEKRNICKFIISSHLTN